MAALVGHVGRGVVVNMGRGSVLRGCNAALINPKRFVRALRRRPVAVLYPDGKRETLVKSNLTADKTQYERVERLKPENATRPVKPVKQRGPSTSSSNGPIQTPSVKDLLGGLRYEKALPGDKRLARVASIARSRASREEEGKVLLEGARLICDALAAGATPLALFFSRPEKLVQLPLHALRQASLVKVKFEDLKTWSDLVTPQGVIAIFSKPDASCLTFPRAVRQQTVPLSLICDGVRDAGALGTLLRGAAAAGCERALLTKGCVDAWEPKVLRAAMGAHFRLPVLAGLDWDGVAKNLPQPLTVHVADNCGSLARSTFAEFEHEGVEEYVESDSDDDELSLQCLEMKVYHESWAQSSTALVVTGDLRWPSSEAVQLAVDTGGHRLCVPAEPGAGGLNAAGAASVLMFEGRRQLLQKTTKRGSAVTR
ncbi:rRNA methyltransferase 3A, mitochondrial [Brachyhypopomus gauderio]|uniref:rRNA methyltransferase 3A, mitochondrial n=1 Tax=Brachyhypopomus gauderio TaxID=698409 RepID=UPI004042D474